MAFATNAFCKRRLRMHFARGVESLLFKTGMPATGRDFTFAFSEAAIQILKR